MGVGTSRRVEEGRGIGTKQVTDPFPFPAHQTGHVDFPHPAFRLVSPQHPREPSPPHGAGRRHRGFLASHCDTAGSKGHQNYNGVIDSSSITALFPLSPAHQKQGSFPPPALPGLHGTFDPLRLPDRPPSLKMMLEVRPPPAPGLPNFTQPTFPACRAQYPGGSNRCLSISSPFVRPSPVNRRVGIHDFTFEACSSFTRVTACRIARPPKADFCPEASTWPVAQPSRSVATMPTDNYMGGFLLHK
jgi:hypothetical protein